MLRQNFSKRKEQRREDALARAEVFSKRTPQGRLANLDAKGMVAKKEREKILLAIEKHTGSQK